jgi:hypothetical protein
MAGEIRGTVLVFCAWIRVVRFGLAMVRRVYPAASKPTARNQQPWHELELQKPTQAQEREFLLRVPSI